MRLFIAEKPSVAQAIAKGLGGGSKANGQIVCGNDIITWCFGHMLEMATPDAYLPDDIPKNGNGNKQWRLEDLPIIPKQWKLAPKKEALKQVGVIKDLLKSATRVVNAGDPDREGQNLVDELLDYYNYRGPVVRYWAASMDDVSVKKALADMRPNDAYRPMGDAAFARACADWLIGMNLTRAYTLANRNSGGQSLLTVGRVQTPTLRLVVERDRAIANFKPKPFYKVYVDVVIGVDPTPSYRASWVPSNAQPGLDEEGRLVDEEVAKAFMNGHAEGVVIERSVTPKAQRPPTCYSLSDIQFSANKLYGFGADKTLSICQALYERHKMTTYPRTDSGYLPVSQFDEAPTVLENVVKAAPAYKGLVDRVDYTVKSKTWDDSKITAHHGIIPTLAPGSDIGDLSSDEQSVYDLIVRRYIAQFYPLFRYEQTIILHDFGGERFKASGRTVIEAGWKSVVNFEADALQKKSEDEGKVLPPVDQGQKVGGRIGYDVATTTPPKPYTEGTLIRAMVQMHKHIDDAEMRVLLKDTDGIGTEATRANIISELKRREFLKDQKKAIVSTPLGQGLIDALPEEVSSPLLTARTEEKLKEVEANRLDKYSFIKDQVAFVSDRVEKAGQSSVVIAGDAEKAKVKVEAYTCPKCNKRELIRAKKKKGSGFYWMCKGVFDDQDQCKTFYEDNKGKPVFEEVKRRSKRVKRA